MKEFFKPTISKIVLSLIFFILFVPFINYDNGLRCIVAPCDSDSIGSIILWLILEAPHIYSINYTIGVIGIILAYIIISIIFKIKKK